jgi:hypothetical protein
LAIFSISLLAIGAIVIAKGDAPVLSNALSAHNEIGNAHEVGLRPARCIEIMPGDGVTTDSARCNPAPVGKLYDRISTPLFSPAEIEAAIKVTK